VPRPPFKAVPPITIAANTGNVNERPALGPIEPVYEKSKILAIEAIRAQSISAMVRYLRIGSLATTAASAFPPIAYEREPKVVLCRSNQNRMKNTASHKT
jgi:hypothetical protein